MYSKKAKNQNGITIVSLVITIIVLLILAGITINMALGERGIFGTADSASEKQKIAEYLEKIELARMEVASENLGEVTLNNLKAQIVKDGIVSEERIEKTTANGEEFLKILTKEGYNFVVNLEKSEYAGKGDVIKAPPELREQDIEIKIPDAEVWTNQSKTITLKNNVQGNFTLQYKLGIDSAWIDYESPFEVDKNVTIYATLRNALGERTNNTQYEVDKIDKQKPVVGTLSSTTTTITIAGTDNLSGIVGYAVTLTNSEPSSFTSCTATTDLSEAVVENLEQNTPHWVWLKDQTGNVSESKSINTQIQYVTSISVTPSIAEINVGETTTLSATVSPNDAYDNGYTWSSSDEKIASVDDTGKVTAVAEGTATIYATASDGSEVKGSCIVTIKKKTSYSVGETVTLGGDNYYVMKASATSEAKVTLLRAASYGSYNWNAAMTEGTNYASSLGYTSDQATSRLITEPEARALSSSMRNIKGYYWTSTKTGSGASAWYVSWDRLETGPSMTNLRRNL